MTSPAASWASIPASFAFVDATYHKPYLDTPTAVAGNLLSAGLNLTLGMGDPPQRSWMQNAL